MEKTIKLVTKYFKHGNLMESSLLNRIGSNELFFNFLTNYFVMTVFSDLKRSFIVVTDIFTSIAPNSLFST